MCGEFGVGGERTRRGRRDDEETGRGEKEGLGYYSAAAGPHQGSDDLLANQCGWACMPGHAERSELAVLNDAALDCCPTSTPPPPPAAHTCFNQLDILEYASKEQLRERLMMALHEGSEGFGFA